MLTSRWGVPHQLSPHARDGGPCREPAHRRRPPWSPPLRQGGGTDRRIPGSGAEPLLAVNNIEVIYNHVILVLKGVSLVVPERGIVALLGANGAGKTTSLKAISNLLRAERGEVTKGSVTSTARGSTGSTPPMWSGAA